MENLKIRVNTPEESERAQKAFFALGAKWINSTESIVKNTDRSFLLFYSNHPIFGCSIASTTWKSSFLLHQNKEITLQELESLAVEWQGIKDDDPDFDFSKMVKNADEINAEFGASNEQFTKQANWEAAIKWFGQQSGFPRFGIMWYHPDTVRQACIIAAGLESPNQ